MKLSPDREARFVEDWKPSTIELSDDEMAQASKIKLNVAKLKKLKAKLNRSRSTDET